jgi:hypothetical protein
MLLSKNLCFLVTPVRNGFRGHREHAAIAHRATWIPPQLLCGEQRGIMRNLCPLAWQ